MNMLSTWSGLDDEDDPTDDGLAWLDRLLKADVDVDPPEGFVSRVLAHVDADLRRVPPWRRALATIGVLLSGILLIAWTATQLFADWHQTMQTTPMAAVAVDVARGIAVALLATTPSPSPFDGRTALYALAAVAMAILWFGATVAPRGLVQRAIQRRRP